MTQILRAGVAGAGVFGGYHANKYDEVTGAELTAVFDTDPARVADVMEARGVFASTDFAEVLSRIDVLTVATPATTHAALAEAALAHGVHVLVEKPIAMATQDADRLIALADQRDLVLQVGHQERYVAQAFGLFDRGQPRRVRSRRLNKFSGRAMDVSVVFDLMIHDLDLLGQYADLETAEIHNAQADWVHGDHADKVVVELSFPSGMTAQLSASRIEDSPVRDLLVEYSDGDIGLDFLNRLTRNTTPAALAAGFEGDDRPNALLDPLREGTQRFVDAVRTQTAPTVSGADGRAAMALALRIEDALQTKQDTE